MLWKQAPCYGRKTIPRRLLSVVSRTTLGVCFLSARYNELLLPACVRRAVIMAARLSEAPPLGTCVSSANSFNETVPAMADPSTTAETRRRHTVHELRELLAALDRRVPQVQRAGEVSIARAAAKLRAEAVKRIDELEGRATERPEGEPLR